MKRWTAVSALVASGLLVAGVVTVAITSAWPPETWTAIAAWLTAGTAVAAGIVALHQLGEARRLRQEQTQPYVVAYMDSTDVDPKFVDLVIQNFGSTAATNVRVEIEPTPQRAAGTDDSPEELWTPQSIPVLVPGQQWRTFWDFIPRRVEAGLPDRHEATVRFDDSGGDRPFSYSYVLHWLPYKKRGSIVEYGTHHGAKALREISQTFKRWRESASGGLAVTVRDGDAKDERRREALEERQAEREAGNAENTP
jgi:hypothetical protein